MSLNPFLIRAMVQIETGELFNRKKESLNPFLIRAMVQITRKREVLQEKTS